MERAARPFGDRVILGVRVDDVTLEEALVYLDSQLSLAKANREGKLELSAQKPSPICEIVTPNAEIVMRASGDHSFRGMLNSACLSIPDGAGLLLAGKILGLPLRAQVAGTDLAIALAELAVNKGYRLFILGAGDGVAQAAGEKLAERFPGLTIAGSFSGSPRSEDEPEIIRQIEAVSPVDILFVAYGAPRQERWIYRNQRRLGITVAVGLGGAVDFISGRVPRAPLLWRRLGLDWLYRLIKEPWRWRRQLALPRFVLTAIALRLAKTLHLPTE